MQSVRSVFRQQLGKGDKALRTSNICQQTKFSTFQSPRVVLWTSVLQHSPRSDTSRYTLATPLQQRRNSSFLDDNSVPSNSRQSQKTAREPYFARRRRARNARSKISTLALDHNPISFETAQENAEHVRSSRQDSQQEQNTKNGDNSRTINPKSRRLLLLAGVLLFPVVGRDVIEAIIPGLLGVLIFVGGNVKAAIKWVKSLGPEEKQ